MAANADGGFTLRSLPPGSYRVVFHNEKGTAAARRLLKVRAGETLYLSGALGNLPGTMMLAPGGMAGQARQTMENIGAVLRYCGLDFADIVKCTVMLADMSEWAEFNKIYVSYFAPDRLPARSALGANGLALGAKVEVECIARFPEGTARVIPI